MNVREIEAKSILTKSPVHHGYTANPYAGCEHCCVYCYARYLKDWTGHENEQYEPQESDTEKRKPCINYEDGCEEWAGCPCVYYKAESEE